MGWESTREEVASVGPVRGRSGGLEEVGPEQGQEVALVVEEAGPGSRGARVRRKPGLEALARAWRGREAAGGVKPGGKGGRRAWGPEQGCRKSSGGGRFPHSRGRGLTASLPVRGALPGAGRGRRLVQPEVGSG